MVAVMWERLKRVHPFWWFAGVFVLINALWIIPNFTGAGGLPAGEPAPGFRLPEVSGAGASISLEDMEGRTVLLLFWATWCDACIAEIPTVRSVAERYSGRGFSVLGMNLDGGDREAVASFVARGSIPWKNVLTDEKTAAAYRVRILPALYLVDAEGRVCRRFSGRVGEGRLSRAVEQCL